MGKAGAVLDVLPSVYGGGDETKLIGHVVRALAGPLEAADTDLYRIQRAHRLPVAPHARDILLLAGALDLDEFHFQDLLERELDHELRLDLMRERVRSIAALHLDGLGTPWAVVASAAIFLGARVVPGEDGALLRRLDPDGYSHRAAIEFAHAPESRRESIVLHENPFRRRKLDATPRWPFDGWTIRSSSPDAGRVRVSIRGVEERTVRPALFCPGLPGGIVFNGVVPDGETLVIDEHDGAHIGERDVSRWLLVYRGGMFDYVADGAGLAVEDGGAEGWYAGGDVEDEAPWRRALPLPPQPPLGESSWHFSVAGGVFDGSDFDAATFDPPQAPVGRFDEDPPLDAAVFDVAPSCVVGMAWDERIPCSFKLLLPSHVPAIGGAGDAAPARERETQVAAVLPRFRAAGVTAFVATAADGWVLGQAVLRPPDADEGEGVDFHSMRLVSSDAERLVAFDPTSEER